ncbi:MAG TPA: AAA family ATPase, partial [Candidatus Dependentiae bacterium]|nr:AAA family ATPase [Candidatus Dependentiae bacterium]
ATAFRPCESYYQKPMRNLDMELVNEVLEYAPGSIKEVIETINDENQSESVRVLLVGDPGVGKTTLAQAIAMQTNRPCFIIRAPSLANQYQFSGEQNLIAAISPLFEIDEPCVVIIDEIDALKQYKGDKTNQDASPANTLCNLLDDAEDHPNIVFIATTNKIKHLPEDLKSRFNSVITLPLPNKKARERIIRYHILQCIEKGIEIDLDEKMIKSLVVKTDGFSARDLKAMVQKAKIVSRADSGGFRHACKINSTHMLKAYKQQKPYIAGGWHLTERGKELVEQHGVALSTFAISSSLSLVGIALTERRSAQSMEKTNEQIDYQKKRDKKSKLNALINQFVLQERVSLEYMVPKMIAHTIDDRDNKRKTVRKVDYEETLLVLNYRLLHAQLAKSLMAKGSKEREALKCLLRYRKKMVLSFKSEYSSKWRNLNYDDLYGKVFIDDAFYKDFCDELCKVCGIPQDQVEEYYKQLIALSKKKIEKATIIASNNEKTVKKEEQKKQDEMDRKSDERDNKMMRYHEGVRNWEKIEQSFLGFLESIFKKK